MCTHILKFYAVSFQSFSKNLVEIIFIPEMIIKLQALILRVVFVILTDFITYFSHPDLHACWLSNAAKRFCLYPHSSAPRRAEAAVISISHIKKDLRKARSFSWNCTE